MGHLEPMFHLHVKGYSSIVPFEFRSLRRAEPA